MLRNLFPVLLLAAASFCGMGGEESSPVGLAFAGANSALPLKSASLFSNPAWLGAEPRPTLSVSALNYFGIAGLNQGQGSLCFPLKSLKLAAGFSFLSVDSIYSEGLSAAGASYGWKRIQAGISFMVRYSSFTGESAEYSPGAAAGLNIRLVRGFTLSFAVYPAYNAEGAAIPPLRAGVCYFWPEGIKTALEAEFEKPYPVIVRFAQEVRLFNALVIRAGIRSEPLTLSLGLGIVVRGLSADVAASAHPDLGVSRSGGISFDPPPVSR